MHIPVGTFAVAMVWREAEFKCASCGHQARAEVTSTGLGTQSLLQDRGVDAERAREDATRDITRTIEHVRCPKCGQRNADAAMRYWSRYLFGTAGFILLGSLLGFGPTLLDLRLTDTHSFWFVWFPLLVYFITLSSLFTVAMIRWRSMERRVRWLSDAAVEE